MHKGECVLNAEQTKQLGVANLNRGDFGDGRWMVVNNSFTLNQPTSRRTQQQLAAEASRAMRTAEIRMR